jgi:uncharacterized protein with PIN domain
MINCRRCGIDTPLLDRDQTRCPKCEAEVRALIRDDTRRRTRFSRVKDLTGVAS